MFSFLTKAASNLLLNGFILMGLKEHQKEIKCSKISGKVIRFHPGVKQVAGNYNLPYIRTHESSFRQDRQLMKK